MKLASDGWMRPAVLESAGEDAAEAATFRRICPGVKLVAPKTPAGGRRDQIFGAYIDAWVGHATDPVIRHEGSSGGILTALATWLAESHPTAAVHGVAACSTSPSRSVPVTITTREQALQAAGSRYAPASAVTRGTVAKSSDSFIGKPCEAAALRSIRNESADEGDDAGLILSFFCAGVPSQAQTEDLVAHISREGATRPREIRYRGRGWPGEFQVIGEGGDVASMSYEESWGKHLGRNLQWRCKVCVDGVGEFADIAVGDYWYSGKGGYPSFIDAPGRSVVLARTPRGRRALVEAQSAGVVSLEPVDLRSVLPSQPLQRERRESVIGRSLGRRLSGHRAPVYTGFGLWALALKNPIFNGRAMLGTFIRSRSSRSNG